MTFKIRWNVCQVNSKIIPGLLEWCFFENPQRQEMQQVCGFQWQHTCPQSGAPPTNLAESASDPTKGSCSDMRFKLH